MKPLIRILYLEDDLNDMELVQAKLEEAGFIFQLTAVQTRDEFEIALRQKEYDIILADFRLPMYDGMSAMRLAQQLCPDVPFVFVSGTMGEEAAIDALKQGATDYLLKKNLLRLAPAVERALHEAENQREKKRLEIRLNEQPHFFQQLLDAIPIPVCYKNPEGLYLGCNAAFEAFISLPRNDILGKTIHEVAPKERADKHHEMDLALLGHPGVQTYEVSDIYQDGKHHDVICNKATFVDANGCVAGTVGTLVDITERKQAERERLANLQFFESMDKVNQAIQGTNDLEQMMGNVLDAVIDIFDCDKTHLNFPCNPEAAAWSVQMERVKPGYRSVAPVGVQIPMTPEMANTHRIRRTMDRPILMGAGMDLPLMEVQKKAGDQSNMGMAIYPKNSDAWGFTMEQCSHPRIWTPEEMKVFEAIGRRLADSLTSLLAYRDLHKNEAFLNSIVEHIPNMIFVKEAQTLKYVRFNRAGEQLLGYSRGELLGKTDYEFFLKEEADFFTAKDREVLDSKELLDIPEEMIRNRDNEKLILHTKKIPILDETETPRYLLGISEDITERKQAEEALRESEERFRTLVEQAAEGFLLHDEGKILNVNNAACDMLGYSREELLRLSIWDVDIKAKQDQHRETFWEKLAPGKTFTFESELQRKDGSLIPAEIKLGQVELRGRRLMLGLVRDITEREQAEESLRKLSRATEQSPVSIIITNASGNIEYVNPKFTEVTGYAQAEVLGKNPRILQSGKLSKEFYRQLWETVTAGKQWYGEFHNRKKSGELYWESASISPIFDTTGAITHFVAVKEDITARKSLEAQFHQAQKMESVGRLAGGVAHDFNNMLGAIIGQTDLALAQVDRAHPLFDALQEIRKAAERSANLTRQLLAFARKQTVTPRVLDLNETVEGMLKMLRRLIGENIDLAWLPGAKIWPVKMDPSQIDQILANLSVNARDAISGVGKVTIETHTETIDEAYCADHPGFDPGEYVLLAVSDDGHGMDKETLAKIFEPFFTTKEMGKGTGLGLATVYGIVKQNNGFINVYSEPRHGTTFRIYLPRYSAGTGQMQKKEDPVAPVARGHETILLAEDEPVILEITKMMLERLGYTLLTATTPGEAIRMADEYAGEIHLLLTDVVMPEMNGQDLAKNLIAVYPGLRPLFMSGYTSDVIARNGVLEEGVYYIQKPFSMQDLAVKVRQVLDAH